jgi:5'-nucleotidase / UDP-sugar diphosphatase
MSALRRRARAMTIVVLVLGLSACAGAARPGDGDRATRDLVLLTFLQINDDYTLEPVDGGRRGGMARLATLVKDTRLANPNTVFVLPGDTISPSILSTFLRGEQMIAALNAVGLDLATFGNHEFDFGPDVLAQRMRESTFAWLSANVLDRRTGAPFGGARREVVLTLGGIKVGLFGLTTADTGATSSSGPDVVFIDPLAAGRDAASRLRRDGAQIVVALTHQDVAADRALADTADVDLILGGHEHEPIVAEEKKAVITKAGSDARYLVRVDVWVGHDGRLVERSWTFREVSGRVPPDPAVTTLVARYTERLNRELDVVVGRTDVPLDARGPKVRTEETNVGDLIADTMRARMDADVALLNGGAIRGHRIVPAGPLKKRDVYELLPFTNVLVKLELDGHTLRSVLERGLAQADHVGGGFLQVSGLEVTYDPARPAGSRIIDLRVGGKPLADEGRYTLATADYLARGGDGFTELARARVLVDARSGPDLATIVLQMVAEHSPLTSPAAGRLNRMQR